MKTFNAILILSVGVLSAPLAWSKSTPLVGVSELPNQRLMTTDRRQLPTAKELELRLQASAHAPTAHTRYLQGLRDQERLQQLQAQAEVELELLRGQLVAAELTAKLNQLTEQVSSSGSQSEPLADLELIHASRSEDGWRVTLLWQQRTLVFESLKPRMHGIDVRWDESGVHAQMNGAERSWLL